MLEKAYFYVQNMQWQHFGFQDECLLSVFLFSVQISKDLNIMSSSLSADRVKCVPESIKVSYEQTRECVQ